jgi:hypothetical protein
MYHLISSNIALSLPLQKVHFNTAETAEKHGKKGYTALNVVVTVF